MVKVDISAWIGTCQVFQRLWAYTIIKDMFEAVCTTVFDSLFNRLPHIFVSCYAHILFCFWH